MGVGYTMVTGSPPRESGYHPTHHHGDFLVGGIMFGIGFAALYAVGRAVIELTRR
jgi:hypothetical protein